MTIEEPLYTLTSAVAVPFPGRPYVPVSADISPRFNSHMCLCSQVRRPFVLVDPDPAFCITIEGSGFQSHAITKGIRTPVLQPTRLLHGALAL